MEKQIKLIAGTLSLTLLRKDDGIALTQIADRKTRQKLFSGERSLLTVTVRSVNEDTKTSVGTLSGWGFTNAVLTGTGAALTLADNPSLPGVTVSLILTCSENRITWNCSLATVSKDFALYECDYPILAFNSSPDVKFMSPYGCGEVWDSDADELSSTQNYPSYGVSMQYFTFWNKALGRGLYYGVHDGAPAYKKFTFKKVKGEDFVSLYASLPMKDIANAGNSQELCGSLVWELYDGDWYDAAMIYRDWVIPNASWIPENANGLRTDLPDWFRKNTHWWLVRIGNDDSYADTVLRCNAELGLLSSVHMYDWHQIPFDNDYPHYFPVKPNMTSGIYKLKNGGVRVMPYINGRLWDTRDRGLEDWQFSSLGKPNCTKNREGEPFIETYNAKESDGTKVKHSIMCPSTAVWQEKVQENVGTLLNEHGASAVYIDQIAAASPYLCEDKNHAHRPGGGTWWCESYANLLDHVRLAKTRNSAITTECTAEPFMKNIQGYLTWLWVKNNQVPAFPAIYAGLVVMFGRRFSVFKQEDSEGQRMTIAESLVYGEQLGWIDPLTYEKLKNRDFYNKCVKFRYVNGEYFHSGRMLRPPVVTDNAKKLFTDGDSDAYGGILTHSPVYCGLWERASDGAKMLVIVNASSETVKCKVSGAPESGDFILGGEYDKKTPVRNGKFSCTLEPFSVSRMKFPAKTAE